MVSSSSAIKSGWYTPAPQTLPRRLAAGAGEAAIAEEGGLLLDPAAGLLDVAEPCLLQAGVLLQRRFVAVFEAEAASDAGVPAALAEAALQLLELRILLQHLLPELLLTAHRRTDATEHGRGTLQPAHRRANGSAGRTGCRARCRAAAERIAGRRRWILGVRRRRTRRSAERPEHIPPEPHQTPPVWSGGSFSPSSSSSDSSGSGSPSGRSGRSGSATGGSPLPLSARSTCSVSSGGLNARRRLGLNSISPMVCCSCSNTPPPGAAIADALAAI